MSRLKIATVVGTRPNLMKISPILREMKKVGSLYPILIHTDQHYDWAMSDIFFQELNLPDPDYHLCLGSGCHGVNTGQIMIHLEKLLEELNPDIVLVVGDVNSTMAAALVASKLQIPLAHVEAGLRSFDRTMPEEINRVVTDSVSQFLFVTEASGIENLRLEGIHTFLNDGKPVKNVSDETLAEARSLCNGYASTRFGAFVGNVMIDTLLTLKYKAFQEAKIHVPKGDYALLTMHRPSNVDVPETFQEIVSTLVQVAREIPILFPCHPRTHRRIQEFGLSHFFTPAHSPLSSFSPDSSINLMGALGYLDFIKLMANARFVLTDSGGVQEETTILDIPCLTLRDNTERPVTLKDGTNMLVGTDSEKILSAVRETLNGRAKRGKQPVLWDGRASERIVKILEVTGG